MCVCVCVSGVVYIFSFFFFCYCFILVCLFSFFFLPVSVLKRKTVWNWMHEGRGSVDLGKIEGREYYDQNILQKNI